MSRLAGCICFAQLFACRVGLQTASSSESYWHLVLSTMLLLVTSWKDRDVLPITALSQWLSLVASNWTASHEALRSSLCLGELFEILLLHLLSEANLGLLTACDAKLSIRWPQPTAYFENLFVTAVAKQLSAVFRRCLPPSRCWGPTAAATFCKITASPGRGLCEGQGAFFPIYPYLCLLY